MAKPIQYCKVKSNNNNNKNLKNKNKIVIPLKKKKKKNEELGDRSLPRLCWKIPQIILPLKMRN